MSQRRSLPVSYVAIGAAAIATFLVAGAAAAQERLTFRELLARSTEGVADSGGVPIAYVTMGEGPLLIMIHGFPDFWFTWRDQMPALAKHYKVVAISQRGYDKSGKPAGVEHYTMDKLTGDVDAVRKHFASDKAVIVGHDWGGWVAWSYAMAYPQRTERLIVVNLPHPKGIERELATNPQQAKNSQYARNMQQPDSAASVDLARMEAGIVGRYADPDLKRVASEAFKRSSIEAMHAYYKNNYPKPPYTDQREYPPVTCSVLLFHGLSDSALLPGMLNDTWRWVQRDLTLVTLPGVGHWSQTDAAEQVTRTMLRWLTE